MICFDCNNIIRGNEKISRWKLIELILSKFISLILYMNIVFYEIEKDTKCETIWSLRCKPFN